MIPATKEKFTSRAISKAKLKRVAAYARVSTDNEEQLTSYDAQVDYYTNYIQQHEGWVFVKVFADEGISGTNTSRRKGFNEMIEEAMKGNIDLILTKSISRFARNTVDSLSYVRQLKEKGVEIYFEKENIWTFDSKGEVLITIMSSLAQEESRSISENVTWGVRKRFADGKTSVGFARFLGYDKGPNGELVVNPEQAEVVKLIYRLFLEGNTPHSICRELEKRGILTPAKKETWSPSTVLSILKNEKYKGDALLQKTFTPDFLTKRAKKNNGEVPQYYVENDHEAIIDKDMWELVQLELNRRKKVGRSFSCTTLYTSKLMCGTCGGLYSHRIWSPHRSFAKEVWLCGRKYRNTDLCESKTLTEEEIQKSFMTAYSRVMAQRDMIISDCQDMLAILSDTSELDKKIKSTKEKLEICSDDVRELIARNARVARSQDDYNKEYDKLLKRYEKLDKKLRELLEEKQTRKDRDRRISSFISALNSEEMRLTQWNPRLWVSLLDYAKVYSDHIDFVFLDGKAIPVEI